MSRAIEDAPTSLPSQSWTGETVTDTGEGGAILALPHGLPMHDALAPSDRVENLPDLAEPVRGAQHRNWPPNHLGRPVAVHSLGGRVPARDHSVEGLAHDGVIGGVDDRREHRLAHIAVCGNVLSRRLTHGCTPRLADTRNAGNMRTTRQKIRSKLSSLSIHLGQIADNRSAAAALPVTFSSNSPVADLCLENSASIRRATGHRMTVLYILRSLKVY